MAANQVLSNKKQALLGQALPQRPQLRSCRGRSLTVSAQQEQVTMPLCQLFSRLQSTSLLAAIPCDLGGMPLRCRCSM